MDALLDGFPLWIVWIALACGAWARGQATYWIARVAASAATERGGRRSARLRSVNAWLRGEGTARGRAFLHRAGLVAIPVCYLTVGLQTATIAAAGATRLGWLRFTLAQLPGVAAWATIYATVGFAAWETLIAAATRHWWAWAVVAFALLGGAVVVVWRRRLTPEVER